MNEQQTFHINMTNRQLRWERGQHALAPGGLASATRAQRDACDHVHVSRRRGKCTHNRTGPIFVSGSPSHTCTHKLACAAASIVSDVWMPLHGVPAHQGSGTTELPPPIRVIGII